MTTHSHYPRPADRETLPSFLCRVAASKGVNASALAYDLGASFKRFITLETEALDRLAQWSRLSRTQLEDLLSWTGEPIGGVRMRFRGEVFISRALRNPVVRGCPACLREDALTCPDAPLSAMTMRGDWQMREMTVCVHHRAALVPLWTVKHPLERVKSDTHLSKILQSILAGDLDGHHVVPSPYDLWLSNRLVKGHDATWLGGQNLHAATTFCRLLGTELISTGGEDGSATTRRSAHAAGFKIAQQGDEAIRTALRQLAAAADGHLDEPAKAFGGLWDELGSYHLEDETFTTFTSLLRDTVFEIWPVMAGQPVIGQALTRRKLHSVLTASREIGVDSRRLRPLLIEAGVLAEDDPRPDSRATFEAQKYNDLLQELGSLVSDRQMRTAIGATEVELASLEADGVLVPRTRIGTAKKRWLIEDGTTFVEDLASRAIAEAGDAKWETIQIAKVNSGVSVGRIISAIRAGQIRLHRPKGEDSHHGLMVCRSEFDAIPTDRQPRAKGRLGG